MRLLILYLLLMVAFIPKTKTVNTDKEKEYHDEEYTYEDEDSENTDENSEESDLSSDITRINCPLMCHCEYNSSALDYINHLSTNQHDYYDYDTTTSSSSSSSHQLDETASLNLTVNCANASLTTLNGLFDDSFPVEHIIGLNLAGNQLASLKSTEFEYMTSLERLDISSNPSLSSIPLTQLKALISLKELIVNDLELLCDCALKQLIAHLNKNDIVMISNEKSRCQLTDDSLTGTTSLIDAHMSVYPNCEASERVAIRIEPKYDQLVFEGDSLKLRCRLTLPKRTQLNLSRVEMRWSVNGRWVKSIDLAKSQRHFSIDILVNKVSRQLHAGLWTCALVDKMRNMASINESRVSVNVLTPGERISNEIGNGKGGERKCGSYEVKNTMKGDYVLGESEPGQVVTMPCRVNGERVAKFRCSNTSGAWVGVDLDACEYEAASTRLLNSVVHAAAGDERSLGEALKRLGDMLQVNASAFSAFDLSMFVDVVERVASEDSVVQFNQLLKRFFEFNINLIEQSHESFNTMNKLNLIVQRFYFIRNLRNTNDELNAIDDQLISGTFMHGSNKSIAIFLNENHTQLEMGEMNNSNSNKGELVFAAKLRSNGELNEGRFVYWHDGSLIGPAKLQSGILSVRTSVVAACECVELTMRHYHDAHAPSSLTQLFDANYAMQSRFSLAYAFNSLNGTRRSLVYTFKPLHSQLNEKNGFFHANICNTTQFSLDENSPEIAIISFALIKNDTFNGEKVNLIDKLKYLLVILAKNYKIFDSYSIYFGAVATQMLLMTLVFVYIAKSNYVLMPNRLYHCLINTWLCFALLNLNEVLAIKQNSLPLLCLFSALFSHFFTLSTCIWFVLLYYNFYKKLSSCHENNERIKREHAERKLKKQQNQQQQIKKINLTSLSKRDPSLFNENDDDDDLDELDDEGEGYEAKPLAHLYMLSYGVASLLCAIGLACAKLDYFMPYAGSVFEHCYVNQHEVFVMTLAMPLAFLLTLKLIFFTMAFMKLRCILSAIKKEDSELKNENYEDDDSDESDADAVSHCTSVMDTQFRPESQLFVSMLLFYIFIAKCLVVYLMVDKIVDEYRLSFCHALLSIAFSITCFSFYCLARDDVQFNGFYHFIDFLVALWRKRQRKNSDEIQDDYVDYEKPPVEFIGDGLKMETNFDDVEAKNAEDKVSNHSSLSTSSLSVLMKNLKEIKEAFEGVNGASPAKIYGQSEAVVVAKETVNEYQLLNEKTTSLISFIDQHATATLSSKEENCGDDGVGVKKTANRRYQHHRNPSTLSGCLNDADQQLISSIIHETQTQSHVQRNGVNETSLRSDTSSLLYQSVSNRTNRTSRRPLYVFVEHTCTENEKDEKNSKNEKEKVYATVKKEDNKAVYSASASSNSVESCHNGNSSNRRQSVDDTLKTWTRRISDASQFKNETSV